jgi:nicotinate-nucleotide adenylyltransferase
MPANRSPFKAAEADPGPQRRLHMCELLVRDDRGLYACALEIERGGASYTVDTLASIHASHPDAELTFIVGADTASTIPEWRDPARVLELARLAVAARPGTSSARVRKSLERIDARDRVAFLEMPEVDVSSALVRRLAADGERIEPLVGPAVAAYIAEQGLYRAAPGGRG